MSWFQLAAGNRNKQPSNPWAKTAPDPSWERNFLGMDRRPLASSECSYWPMNIVVIYHFLPLRTTMMYFHAGVKTKITRTVVILGSRRLRMLLARGGQIDGFAGGDFERVGGSKN